MEIKKDELVLIPGFSNYYIDKQGNVYNKHFRKLSIMKYRHNFYVSLPNLKDSKSTYRLYNIAKLLAITFIPNPNNYKWVTQKNGVTEDISLDNLYWTEFHKTPDADKTRIIAFKCLDNNRHCLFIKFVSEISKYDRLRIRESIKSNIKYKGYYWESIKDTIGLCCPLTEDISHIYNMEDDIDRKILHEQIINIMQSSLDNRQFNIMFMRYFEGRTLREIAKIIELSVDRVRQIIEQSLKKLRKTGKFDDMHDYLS